MSAVRDVLIEATKEIPHGSEGYVGWSVVLAERIVVALAAVPHPAERDVRRWTLYVCPKCGAHNPAPLTWGDHILGCRTATDCGEYVEVVEARQGGSGDGAEPGIEMGAGLMGAPLGPQGASDEAGAECEECAGTGQFVREKWFDADCPTCGGTGFFAAEVAPSRATGPCPDCSGKETPTVSEQTEPDAYEILAMYGSALIEAADRYESAEARLSEARSALEELALEVVRYFDGLHPNESLARKRLHEAGRDCLARIDKEA